MKHYCTPSSNGQCSCRKFGSNPDECERAVTDKEMFKEDYNSDCPGWNNCYHCDNGWYPCNQYCIVMGD